VTCAGSLARETSLSNTETLSARSPMLPVAEGYSRWAPTYDSVSNPLLACEERHLLPLLNDVSHRRVLDLACGTGRWLTKLVAQNPSGVGIDCSRAMLQVARGKQAIAHRLVGGVCEVLPFRAASFDLVICSFALGHVRDLNAAVEELARVTRPGADLFVSDLHPEAYARGWRVGFRDENMSVTIEMVPRTAEKLAQAFAENQFQCELHRSLWLGDPEQPLFARAGKSELFIEACKVPAVFFCHFRRSDLVPDRESSANAAGFA